jgi:hypothetical protein
MWKSSLSTTATSNPEPSQVATLSTQVAVSALLQLTGQPPQDIQTTVSSPSTSLNVNANLVPPPPPSPPHPFEHLFL